MLIFSRAECNQEEKHMKVESILTNNDESVVITVHGRFDFSVANDFRNSYRNIPVKSEYILELSSVDYMDSAAIGMILLLHEFSGNTALIKAINCSESIKKIILMSHIDRFVQIAA